MKTNAELQKDVMDEIKWSPMLWEHASEIGVSALDGVVTLTGEVDSYSKKLAAERAAQRVSGVKVVAADIEVKVNKYSVKTDADIAELVKSALKWHSLVQDEHIKVKVEKGWIYLEGTADWGYQKDNAAYAVENLVGVKGVINTIVVKAKVSNPAEIKNKIVAAFNRNAAIDGANITVETSGSIATLRGTVRSYAEKRAAENAAWFAPGITIVNNKIEIDTEIFA